ncbi:MAG: hypothetical protein WCR02_07720 [Sphaerochaetaceae bacterium]
MERTSKEKTLPIMAIQPPRCADKSTSAPLWGISDPAPSKVMKVRAGVLSSILMASYYSRQVGSYF